jgi:muramoyltetrapeptide carboxypeptidase
MKRRIFIKNASLAGLAAGFNPLVMTEADSNSSGLLKPARLRPGATVALIAPAGPFPEEKLAAARRNFAMLELRVKEGANLNARNGYLAGTDEQRLADLHEAFRDTAVEAIWCLRGGYGCTRLLPRIEFDLIRQNPKLLIGYSDITALHIAIQQQTGLVTFHGPVAASDLPENTLRHFRAALMEPLTPYEVTIPDTLETLPGQEFKPFVITAGRAGGALTGGNLSLLAAMAGTAFSPSFRNKLVFLEDVGEQPYRIDRMLTQLLQATDLPQAAGIALGVFFDCRPKPDSASLTLEETLRDRLGPLNIPVIYGIPFGHVPHQATFPYGVEAELDTEKGSLILLEAGVR